MAQLKAPAPFKHLLFLGQDSISLRDSVSSKKNGHWKRKLAGSIRSVTRYTIHHNPSQSITIHHNPSQSITIHHNPSQSIQYDGPNETLPPETQLLPEGSLRSDPITRRQSLVPLPGHKNSLRSCTPAMGISLGSTVQLIWLLKSHGFCGGL